MFTLHVCIYTRNQLILQVIIIIIKLVFSIAHTWSPLKLIINIVVIWIRLVMWTIKCYKLISQGFFSPIILYHMDRAHSAAYANSEPDSGQGSLGPPPPKGPPPNGASLLPHPTEKMRLLTSPLNISCPGPPAVLQPDLVALWALVGFSIFIAQRNSNIRTNFIYKN